MVKFYQTGDFRAGLFYLAVGIAAMLIGRNYTMGTADDMGSGYFPFLLSLILIVIGVASIARCIIGKRVPSERVHLRAMTLITGATLAFGMIVASVGAVIAVPILTLLSASASRNFVFGWKSVSAAIALSLCCIVVFIKALGLSIPVTGWLFGSYL